MVPLVPIIVKCSQLTPEANKSLVTVTSMSVLMASVVKALDRHKKLSKGCDVLILVKLFLHNLFLLDISNPETMIVTGYF